MRLIDADALKEKFKEHYDLFVGDYKGEHMNLADELRVDEILNSMAEVINAPTIFDTDNATNGEVIKAMFNVKEVDMSNTYCVHFPEEEDYSHYFFKDWWNAPYQKGGNKE